MSSSDKKSSNRGRIRFLGKDGMREMRPNRTLNCGTCINEDGTKGKWKHISHFGAYMGNAYDVQSNCKVCLNAKKKEMSRKARENKRKRNPVEIVYLHAEPRKSRVNQMITSKWNQPVSFKGVNDEEDY